MSFQAFPSFSLGTRISLCHTHQQGSIMSLVPKRHGSKEAKPAHHESSAPALGLPLSKVSESATTVPIAH